MVSFRLSTLVILIDTLSSSSSGTFQPLRIGRRGKRAVNGSGRIATWQILPVQLTIPLAGPADPLLAKLRRILNLDEDLSGFYAVAAADADLAWAAAGAGRMVRSPTVFEDVVKTRCPQILPRVIC